MTTRAELLGRIRNELNDTGTTKLWADALLQGWIGEAIRDYSERLPREATTTWASVAGQASYVLPADFATALRVEHPAGFYRVYAPLAGGDVLEDTSALCVAVGQQVLTFDVFGGSLLLDPAPDQAGDVITLRYLAVYAEPTADGDVLATPSRDDELLVWLACARALEWIGTDEAKRMRFERQRGVSAQDQARVYAERYREAVELRMRRPRQGRRLVAR